MTGLAKYAVMFLCLVPFLAFAGKPKELSKRAYEKDLAVVILQINWGRAWRCGQYENAQLEALTFSKAPVDQSGGVTYELKTPSRLFVKNGFVPYGYLVQPGGYDLTAFDVKVARSTTDVIHIRGTGGTPFISFYTPAEIQALARGAGFKEVEHVSAEQLAERYFSSRSDDLRPPRNSEEMLVATS